VGNHLRRSGLGKASAHGYVSAWSSMPSSRSTPRGPGPTVSHHADAVRVCYSGATST
jgi:hypothetical protein